MNAMRLRIRNFGTQRIKFGALRELLADYKCSSWPYFVDGIEKALAQEPHQWCGVLDGYSVEIQRAEEWESRK
jgi:hypothetical protein